MSAMQRIRLLVGTIKGGFVVHADAERSDWKVEGPLFKGWKVTASLRDAEGTFWLGTASDVYGAAIQRSTDLEDWSQVQRGPSYSEASGRKLVQIWTLASAHGVLWAGVDEAGLFRSEDGETWRAVEGLNDHPTRDAWYPGAGGLCAHRVLFDPENPDRIWCGISAVGVFRSDDGGLTWRPRNDGVRMIIEDREHKDIGFCVHGLDQDPRNPDRIYRQDHAGMYRTSDGGDTWEANDSGLESWFGFPITLDRSTGHLYCVPLESDEYRVPKDGRLRVFRSTDAGDSWSDASNGLPQRNAWAGVLRAAFATDHAGGLYFGTTSGTLHVSTDSAASWTQLPVLLPRVLSVEAYVD